MEKRVKGKIEMNKKDYQPGLVSIIMPCYNGAQFLSETIESVQMQTYSKWELLIVDDGSSDNSVDIVKKYAKNDQRIIQISQENGGSAAARNNGISKANGQYIALLDSDDLWLPDFLDEQIKFMKEMKAVCVCCTYGRIDEQSNDIMKPVKAKSIITAKDMEAIDYIGCLSGLYDRSEYGKIYLHEELKSLLDDYAYWIDIVNLEGVAYGNPKLLAKYRLRKNSMTRKKSKLVKIHYHFYRHYRGFGVIKSLICVLKWGINGTIKYSG